MLPIEMANLSSQNYWRVYWNFKSLGLHNVLYLNHTWIITPCKMWNAFTVLPSAPPTKRKILLYCSHGVSKEKKRFFQQHNWFLLQTFITPVEENSVTQLPPAAQILCWPQKRSGGVVEIETSRTAGELYPDRDKKGSSPLLNCALSSPCSREKT